jgi:hypothetical protein
MTMKHRSIPLFLFVVVSACTQLNAQGPHPGPAAEPGAASASLDQWSAQLEQTALELDLTPRQRVVWEDYENKTRALMNDQLRTEPTAPRRLTAPQQIDTRVTTVRHRLAAIEEVAAAATHLYEILDPGQKAIADRRLAATVPPLYSGLISCAPMSTPGGPGDKPGGKGAPPRR